MSPKPTIKAPTTDVTPEQCAEALVRELNAAGIDGLLGKGARNNAMRIALGQLHTAISQVKVLEDQAKALRAGMGDLVKTGLDAIAGKAPLKSPKATTEPKVNGGDPQSATTAPTV